MKQLSFTGSTLLVLVLAASGSACKGGGKSEPPKPAAAHMCTTIAGCTQAADGSFQFPDGNGGIVKCSNGTCVTTNDTLSSNWRDGYAAGYNQGSTAAYQPGYEAGATAGQTEGYNAGYAAGKAAVDSANYNSGYNAGYQVGHSRPTPGAYNDGYTAGLDDGYDDGYSDANDGWGYWDGQDDGYDIGYDDGHADGYATGYDSGYYDGYYGYSVGHSSGGKTKDVDLQRAELAETDENARAERIAAQFQMSVESAKQITQLADRVQKLSVANKLTAADRAAINTSAMEIAGVTPEQVTEAVKRSMQGDDSATDALMDKAASNLGMSSTADLRDRLLPSLGIDTK